MNRKILIASIAALSIGNSAFAQMTHDSTMDHNAMNQAAMDQGQNGDTVPMRASTIPTEPGQGAFAALIEIVAMLRNDPETDWNKVDIDGLRQHLVDMDMLITNAEVKTEKLPNGLMFTASRSGLGGGAVSRMVPAHGPFLTAETGWSSDAKITDDAVIWAVTSDTDFYIIQALGFFGLMTIGNHHQAHHIGMAKGGMVHNQ